MPISFEQAAIQAGNLNGLVGGAAAQLGQQNLGLLSDIYSRAAQLRAQQGAQAAQLAAQVANQSYANQQEGLMGLTRHQEILDQQRFARDRFESSLGPTSRDIWEAQQQQATKENLMRLQSQLHTQELSAAEDRKLDLMKQRYSELMSEGNPFNLSDEERNAAAMMLRTGIDPLELRRQNASARQMEMHTKQYEEAVFREKAVQQKIAQTDALTMDQRTSHIQLPDGTTATLVQTGFDQRGNPTYTQIKHESRPAVEKPVKPFDSAEAERLARMESKAAYPLDEEKRAEYEFKVYQREKAKWESQQGIGQGSGASQPSGFGGQTPTYNQQQQSEVKSRWESRRDLIRSASLPENAKRELLDQYARATQLLANYGYNPHLMPPHEQSLFNAISANIAMALGGQSPAGQPKMTGPAKNRSNRTLQEMWSDFRSGE
jgi:hypothetical protein